MDELSARIQQALVEQEQRAEVLASIARLLILTIFAFIIVLNIRAVSMTATEINLVALLIAYLYGLWIFRKARQKRYHPSMKYVTTAIDILLLFGVLFMYTTIELPSVALKHHVFLILFPLVALTVFRYDVRLTVAAGVLSLILYAVLYIYVMTSAGLGGYFEEFFTDRVSVLGQATKLLIYTSFIAISAYLAYYSREMIVTLVRTEVRAESEKESLERELELASYVQANLLPRTPPSVERIQLAGLLLPRRFVGGDYYDFIKLSPSSLLFVVADVSGKGVPASLTMAQVRASTHLLASGEFDLDRYVARLNSLLQESTTAKDFVTLFAGVVDTNARTITYLCAGHPSPIIASSQGLRLLTERTLPLGFVKDLPQCVVHVVPFLPGSRLIAYTDGIVESRNAANEEYGEERLRTFVQENLHLDSEEFSRRLIDDVRAFGGTKPFDDDAAVAVATFK